MSVYKVKFESEEGSETIFTDRYIYNLPYLPRVGDFIVISEKEVDNEEVRGFVKSVTYLQIMGTIVHSEPLFIIELKEYEE